MLEQTRPKHQARYRGWDEGLDDLPALDDVHLRSAMNRPNRQSE
jgi:hypothetical protein